MWKYGDQNREVVNSYKYLGLHFTTKQSLIQTVGELAKKGEDQDYLTTQVLVETGKCAAKRLFLICIMHRSYPS